MCENCCDLKSQQFKLILYLNILFFINIVLLSLFILFQSFILTLQQLEPEKIDAGAKIRSVIKRRLDKMIQMIKKNGWLHSLIRVVRNPQNPERYLCIDGMHRVTAMQQIRKEDQSFMDVKLETLVYPAMSEFDQCILADSNLLI